MRIKSIIYAIMILGLLAGCAAGPTAQATDPVSSSREEIKPSLTPTQPPTIIPPTPTPTEPPEYRVWISPAVPAELANEVRAGEAVRPVEAQEEAEYRFDLVPADQALSLWTYALTAPFPTLLDGVTLEQARGLWAGSQDETLTGWRFLLTDQALAVLRTAWGEPAEGMVDVLPAGELLDAAWEAGSVLSLVPFEKLEPRWKVLRVDGISPLDQDFQPEDYALTFGFGFAEGQQPPVELALTAANRDPEKMTVLMMTGVTALVRATAHRMETKGLTYPAEKIGPLLSSADLTHISNEVSFYSDCPFPDPGPGPLYFCSRPSYIEVLEASGADIVELTGNHNNDSAKVYGVDVVPETLELYRERGMLYYGGGLNLDEASRPALVEHNGNKLAFIGCNPAGPIYAWATEDSPGAAPCEDYQWMKDEIARLRAEGYLPIATFQYFEIYSNLADPEMEVIFREIADAGAVVVQGSQAHTPKEMEFFNDSFIHYGLGNLYFDQMHVYQAYLTVGNQQIPTTRLEFVDRHVFYNGRHISTDLITLMLEDYAQPRLMTAEEREAFLTDIFATSGWRISGGVQ
ncbi:MAG TPA: CapA family protein [Chloroflexi bacterium]|nr:CapA family protein [Chloroflexota bacterium]